LVKLNWHDLCLNTNIPIKFFEKHLDKVKWHSLCYNENMPIKFFEKHLDKVDWLALCRNTNIPVEFFEKHLDKVHWMLLCCNNFDKYFKNLEIKENKKLLKSVFEEIDSFVLSIPPSCASALPKGGFGYLEMIAKYHLDYIRMVKIFV